MSTPKGRSILIGLGEFVSRRWFTKDFPVLVQKIIDVFQTRNQVVLGGLPSVGASVTASVLQVSTTALDAVLNGRIKAQLAAQTNVDLFTTAGVVAQPIFTDGSTAAAISLGTSEEARVALIVCNTDGAGAAVDTDNGVVKLLAVVAGTATTYATKTAPPTSVEIQAALEASTGVHAGVTGWAWLGSIVWDENAGSPTGTVTPNRNNVISAL